MALQISRQTGALLKTQCRFASVQTTSNIAKLECERKFTPTHALRTELESGDQSDNPPKMIIHDKYFDYQDLMKRRGVYVRLRSEYTLSNSNSKTQWEAKVRLGGDYENSQFEEVVGAVEVVKAIQEYHGDFSMDILRDIEMNIVIDNCTFNYYPSFLKKGVCSTHVVGEVEMTKTVNFSDDVQSDEALKKETVTDMSEALDRYVSNRPKLFLHNDVPIGKLTAYFAWKAKIDEKERSLEKAKSVEESKVVEQAGEGEGVE